jgi:outer membrane immunogenic protein
MYSWAGWYAGVNVGAAGQSNFWSGTEGTNVNGTHSGTSFIAGGQIGHNWQQGKFVYGFEVDFSGLSNSGRTYVNDCCGTIYGSNISFMSTMRGRWGMTVGDGSTLVYGTGGLAIANINAKSEGGPWPINDYSRTRFGWTVGAGIEHMFSRHWTFGVEALYADFGSYTAGSTVDGKCCATIRDRVMIGRFKANYKF